jgi:hypothetical protein
MLARELTILVLVLVLVLGPVLSCALPRKWVPVAYKRRISWPPVIFFALTVVGLTAHDHSEFLFGLTLKPCRGQADVHGPQAMEGAQDWSDDRRAGRGARCVIKHLTSRPRERTDNQ